MEWIGAEIIALLIGQSRKGFIRLFHRIKLNKVKRMLEVKIQADILDKYQHEPFFNELDRFLMKKKVIDAIYCNNYSPEIGEYKTKDQLRNYYGRLFVEKNQQYLSNKSDVEWIIEYIFKISFSIFNDFRSDEKMRIMIMNFERIVGELRDDFVELHIKIESMETKPENTMQVDGIENVVCLLDENIHNYLESCKEIFFGYNGASNYIDRKVCKSEESYETLINAVKSAKQSLVLGEAGLGKTLEARKLLYDFVECYQNEQLVPIYLPLIEYGKLYDSIEGGIIMKLSNAFGPRSSEILEYLLDEGRVVIILDGLDDVKDGDDRTKCILEINNLRSYRVDNIICVFSRENQYHEEFGEIRTYNLCKLNYLDINKALRDNGIFIEITAHIQELFECPLLLRSGIQVLKKQPRVMFFNKAELYEELMLTYLYKWDAEKGIGKKHNINISELMSILGRFAFDTFDQNTYTPLEFENQINDILSDTEKVSKVLAIFINSGLFDVGGSISFTHKTYKEFFAAYYINENSIDYSTYIRNGEWKEIFVFLSGIVKILKEKDELLNHVLENNLSLYIDCVKGMGNSSRALNKLSKEDYEKRYLEELFSSYTALVSQYFKTLKLLMDPPIGKNMDISEYKMCIVGGISRDRKHLYYCFDWISDAKESIIVLSFESFQEYQKDMEKRAFFECRPMSSSFVNLELSGYNGDAARLIAVKKLKNEIDDVIKERRLKESIYLKGEVYEFNKSKIQDIKDIKSISKVHEWISKNIELDNEEGNLVSSMYNNIELFDFLEIVEQLMGLEINITEIILPKQDRRPNGGRSYIWDLYSLERKIQICSLFFYWHQLSYIEMVEMNFSNCREYLKRYSDTPYQTIINFQDNATRKGYGSEPILHHYNVASKIGEPMVPKVVLNYCQDELRLANVRNKIESSYSNIGKKSKSIYSSSSWF